MKHSQLHHEQHTCNLVLDIQCTMAVRVANRNQIKRVVTTGALYIPG